jgi:hypothetical protein
VDEDEHKRRSKRRTAVRKEMEKDSTSAATTRAVVAVKREKPSAFGCKCILHTEFEVCTYCPSVGCTKCSWIEYAKRNRKKAKFTDPIHGFIVE